MKARGIVLLTLDYWRRLPIRTKRILTIVAFFVISFIVTLIGVLTPLSLNEAKEINKDLNQTLENIKEMGNFQMITFIFGNNFILCLTMFVPIAGIVFGFYVLYNTGVVIAAMSISLGMPPHMGLLLLFLLPVAWLEFLAYSIAFAESVWLTRRIIQRRGKNELVKACILVSICAVILVVAAIVEVALIASVPRV